MRTSWNEMFGVHVKTMMADYCLPSAKKKTELACCLGNENVVRTKRVYLTNDTKSVKFPLEFEKKDHLCRPHSYMNVTASLKN